jgi:hypothetical protein
MWNRPVKKRVQVASTHPGGNTSLEVSHLIQNIMWLLADPAST